MKPVLRLMIGIAAVITFLPACQKSSNDSNNLEGTWELRKTTAAMVPQATNYPEGNGNRLIFSGNQYEKYENGVLVKSGQFSVIEDLSVEQSVCLDYPDGEFTDRLIYDNDTNAQKVFLKIAGNTLTLVSGCYALDAGHTMEYKKTTTNKFR